MRKPCENHAKTMRNLGFRNEVFLPKPCENFAKTSIFPRFSRANSELILIWFSQKHAQTCVNLFSPRCKPITEGFRKFTQVFASVRSLRKFTQVFASFRSLRSLRRFTLVNLMTQVYAGSPTHDHCPAFVTAVPAVAEQPGLEPPAGARLARPGLCRRRPRRRGDTLAGAAWGPAGPARPSSSPPPPSRRTPGRSGPWPGRFGPARPFVADIKICDKLRDCKQRSGQRASATGVGRPRVGSRGPP
jgi:hypothetical protein